MKLLQRLKHWWCVNVLDGHDWITVKYGERYRCARCDQSLTFDLPEDPEQKP